ncbi:MAG: PAS domain S-box protein, partial [Methanoregula sp.]|nr:PAS domain S-box protein [Methanoregula sp.]
MGVARDITTRKRAEEQLTEFNERFKNVARATNDIVWDWELKTNNLWWSDSIYTVFGYQHEDIESTIESWYNRLHPEDRDRTITSIHAVIDGGGQSWSGDYRFRKADSSYAYVFDRGFVIRDIRGKAVRMIGAMLDITERKRANEMLQETKDYLQNLIRYANAPIIVWNAEFRITEFNRAFESLTGLTRDQAIGRHLHILFPTESCNSSMDQIHRTLSGEQWEVVEISIRHVSGQTRTVLWNSANIKDPEGTIIATIAQGQDITERKRVEDALKESEIRFRTILDQASDAIIIHNVHGRLVNVNQKACQNLGYTRDELLSMNISDIDPDAIESGKDQIWQNIILGHNVSFESREKRKDGSTFPVEITLGPIKLENEVLIIGIVHDITERRKAEAALRESEELFKGVAERSSDLILLVDKGGIATYVSPSVERILGYLPDEIVGKTPEDFIIPDDITTVWEGVNKSVSGEYVGGVTVHSRKKSGEYAIMEMTASPIIKEDRI